MAKHPDYPANLTQASWSQEKGVIAKVLKKDTGIGAAMTKAEAAYQAVDWNKFNADTQLAHVDVPADVDAVKTAAGQEYKTKVETLRKAVQELRDKAKTTAADFKKNKLIPGSSTKHAEAVAAAADHFWIALKDNAPYIVDFVKECETAKKELVTEKIKHGELPQNWDDAWWIARAPKGLADDKIATKIGFFYAHYVAYPKYRQNDDSVIDKRINCLRQMMGGLNEGEKAIRATIGRCKPGIHDNTKAALQHYLALLPAYRQQRKQWIDQEKVIAQNNEAVRRVLQEKVIGAGLDRL